MIMLFIGWFESRITFYSHTSRHTEPNIAVGDLWMVAAYIVDGDRVEIRVSSDGGLTWSYVRDITWGSCSEVVDPVVDEDPIIFDKFFIGGLV